MIDVGLWKTVQLRTSYPSDAVGGAKYVNSAWHRGGDVIKTRDEFGPKKTATASVWRSLPDSPHRKPRSWWVIRKQHGCTLESECGILHFWVQHLRQRTHDCRRAAGFSGFHFPHKWTKWLVLSAKKRAHYFVFCFAPKWQDKQIVTVTAALHAVRPAVLPRPLILKNLPAVRPNGSPLLPNKAV